jgi:hypothetical protein
MKIARRIEQVVSETASCATCIFLDASAKDGRGICRRNPPAPTSPQWPQVGATDWCGEYADEAAAGSAERSPAA